MDTPLSGVKVKVITPSAYLNLNMRAQAPSNEGDVIIIPGDWYVHDLIVAGHVEMVPADTKTTAELGAEQAEKNLAAAAKVVQADTAAAIKAVAGTKTIGTTTRPVDKS
jgi:hypothetical protein